MKSLAILATLVLATTGVVKAEVLNCGGTEPFWSLEINEDEKTMTYTAFMTGEDEGVVYKKLKKNTSVNDLSVRSFKAKKGLVKKQEISAFVTVTDGNFRKYCSDGMSDFDFQYEVFVDIDGMILQGCCESTKRPRIEPDFN